MKIVIVGGVAGGATAAARLRRLDESAEIIMIERTGYVSYANCGLPYYIGGVIENRSKLTLQTPESFAARFRVDARVRQEVIAIDRTEKRVTIKRLDDGGVYEETYDKLILSPGAKAVKPPIPGIDSPRVHTLRTVEDTFAIKDAIERDRPRRALVVGAGFIGLEMAENLRDAGIEVIMAQRGSHVMPVVDNDMAELIHTELARHGVKLLLNTEVSALEETERGIRAHIGNAETIDADIAILSIGVVPETHLAQNAGLRLGLRGAICVDDRMRTSDPDIFAVGDAIEARHTVTGNAALIALAGPANKQGRIAADNICGIDSTFNGSLGTSVLKLFSLTVATTGLTLAAAREAGIAADAVILSPANHATYYPGSSTIVLKVVFDTHDGRILGAQAIGREGTEKRIDVLAVAIRAHMSASDLAELDLAYAPPYSSAKDPVNMAGFMIENILTGLVEQVNWDEALRQRDDTVLIDTRTDAEYARGHIECALHIPVDSLRERLDEITPNKRVLVYCQSGLRSYVACRILSQHGFSCANVAGGFGFYEQTHQAQPACPASVGPCGMKA